MDCIRGILYKHLPPSWIGFLGFLFNKIMEEERVPRKWGNFQSIMIFKKVILKTRLTIDLSL